MRRALTATLLAGVALATTGAAPDTKEAMLEQFDRVLTAMSYAAAPASASSPSSGRVSS